MKPNVVVTCTKRKRHAIPSALRLGRVSADDLETRCLEWIHRLESTRCDRFPALDLYAGEHWQTARTLSETGAGATVSVISAGYGFVPLEATLKPYAATFSGHEPDAVVMHLPSEQHNGARSQWWEMLSRWQGPNHGSPRSIADLARRHPNRPLMIVASEPYLRACAADLVRAREGLADADLMLIISTGARLTGQLSEHLLPADARLQHILGGTRQALNVRIARLLLAAEGQLFGSLRRAQRALTQKLVNLPPLRRYDRMTRRDSEIREFIASQLRNDPSTRPHPLLRLLRDRGFACEQARFSSLYREVKDGLSHA
jgi:hypothetical protein